MALSAQSCFLPIVLSRSVPLSTPFLRDGTRDAVHKPLLNGHTDKPHCHLARSNQLCKRPSESSQSTEDRDVLNIVTLESWRLMTEHNRSTVRLCMIFNQGKYSHLLNTPTRSPTPGQEFGINVNKCNSPKSFPSRPGK